MISEWFSTNPPIYDMEKDYAENAVQGPFFPEPLPNRLKPEKNIDFLGFKLNSRIGVPAGPLLNSRWIRLAAALGFDVPTYKTIRSFAYPGHPLPNILFVEPLGPHLARARKEQPYLISDLSITNSFGMPSKSPEFLLQDIQDANLALDEGQVMIVSVVGSTDQGMSFVDDFVRTAQFAKTAGAKIIEANFSCPNVDKAEGSLYMSHDTVYEYTKRISQAIHPVPLILKMGLFKHRDQMQKVFSAAARGGAQGIAAINTIRMEVIDAHGRAALGEGRKTSGVCGSAIRSRALHFIREATEINRKQKLGLSLLGCGGIVCPEHFDEFLSAGAEIAMSATGMMWDPYLAIRYNQIHAKQNTHT